MRLNLPGGAIQQRGIELDIRTTAEDLIQFGVPADRHAASEPMPAQIRKKT